MCDQEKKKEAKNVSSSGAKMSPRVWDNRCKNELFQHINEWEHLGTIDDAYNPMLQFERHFEGWSSQLILFTAWQWYRDQKEPFVYINMLGAYDNIGSFARALQYILPNSKQISVDFFGGEELQFIVYEHKDPNQGNHIVYEARFLDLNQLRPDKNGCNEGIKLELPKDCGSLKPKNPEKIIKATVNDVISTFMNIEAHKRLHPNQHTKVGDDNNLDVADVGLSNAMHFINELEAHQSKPKEALHG